MPVRRCMDSQKCLRKGRGFGGDGCLEAGPTSTLFPVATGLRKLLQNSRNDQNRSTNPLTLGPSPKGRGKRTPAMCLLPLPPGEGWGEDRETRISPDRGTIWTSLRILQQFLRAGRFCSAPAGTPAPTGTRRRLTSRPA
jgi:hypothetical protein